MGLFVLFCFFFSGRLNLYVHKTGTCAALKKHKKLERRRKLAFFVSLLLKSVALCWLVNACELTVLNGMFHSTLNLLVSHILIILTFLWPGNKH